MTMTRQHVEMIAKIISDMEVSERVRAASAKAFADELAKINPLFNRSRFLKACHIAEDGK